MCVVCALCVSVLWHSRTSALSHLADTALPTPARCHTGSHLPTAPCVPRCTTSAFSVVPHCLALGTTLHCVCPAAPLLWAGQWAALRTAWGLWAMEIALRTASLPGGGGQCNSCNALPHCPGAVGSATPAMHCLSALGQWAVQLLQRTASLPGGSGRRNSRNALPHCLGAVGSATPAMHCLTALGQWAVELLQCTASLPGGSGQCNSCNALSHCPGVVGSGTSAMHCLTAWGQWAVQLLQCTVSLPRGSGQCNSCNARPHCLGAVAALLREEAANMATGLGANCVT